MVNYKSRVVDYLTLKDNFNLKKVQMKKNLGCLKISNQLNCILKYWSSSRIFFKNIPEKVDIY